MDSFERVVMAILLAILGAFALSIAIAVSRRRINVRGLVWDETGVRSPGTLATLVHHSCRGVVLSC